MAAISKRGDKWMARVRITGHPSKTKSFATKSKAQAWATQTEAEILAGIRQDDSSKTFADALDRYAAEVSPGKRGARWEIVRIEKFKRLPFACYPIGNIKTPILAKWRDDQLKTLKASSVNREMNLLSSIFEMARKEWQWISINPVRDVGRPSQPKHRERLFNQSEIQAICNGLGYRPEKPIETKQQIIAAAFMLGLETGMRRGEITGLSWDMVNIKRRFVSLAITKNEDARDVPLSPKAVELLESLRGFDRPFSVDSDTLSTLFRRACLAAGIADAHFHDARATALTRLSKIYNVMELARIIGHRDPRSLMIYYRETAESLAGKMWESNDPEPKQGPLLKVVK